MKEFKALTESQLELLEIKVRQIQSLYDQIGVLQNAGAKRLHRMKLELEILPEETKQWNLSKDGKSFWREREENKSEE